MREKGFDLLDNPPAPGWHWKWNEGIGGFELTDSPLIGDCVEQLPKNNCGKSGMPISESCNTNYIAQDKELSFEEFLFGRSVQISFQANLLNNKVSEDFLQIDFGSDQNRDVEIAIYIELGIVFNKQKVSVLPGSYASIVDISNMGPGIYFLKIQGVNPIPFVKVY